jgi:Lipase maturation factor
MDGYTEGLWLVRLVFQRGLAAIYLVAFLTALFQFPALLGERGLLPVRRYIKSVSFLDSPSIFFWRSSDRFVRCAACLGIVVSVMAVLGIPERGPIAASAATWLLLSMLYLSFVNVGQDFYSFGWESMLVEAGFFAAFLGPSWSAPSVIPILVLRWILFRTELGAGLIKLRHDRCWRDLTCLFYHYETQPLPNPLSHLFHRFPRPLHRFSVLFSHFVQVVVPFGLFAPQPVASIAAGFVISHQLLLIVSGNYSWLNWLTVVLGVTAFSDSILHTVLPIAPAMVVPRSSEHDVVLYMLAGAVLVMSVQPVLNFFSKHQLMNYSYNPLHLVNAYGAFGAIARERYEVILEGTSEETISDATKWKEYEFKAKPGRLTRRPPQVAPYHLRIDWLMWFLPFSVEVSDQGLRIAGYELWFFRMVEQLLRGEKQILTWLGSNPFSDGPPRFVRALYYRYRFSTRQERKATGAHWQRELVGEYLPPLSVLDFQTGS